MTHRKEEVKALVLQFSLQFPICFPKKAHTSPTKGKNVAFLQADIQHSPAHSALLSPAHTGKKSGSLYIHLIRLSIPGAPTDTRAACSRSAAETGDPYSPC